MGGELREREETVSDVMHPDREGRMSVIDDFEARCFRKKVFSCCNLCISAWTIANMPVVVGFACYGT